MHVITRHLLTNQLDWQNTATLWQFNFRASGNCVNTRPLISVSQQRHVALVDVEMSSPASE